MPSPPCSCKYISSLLSKQLFALSLLTLSFPAGSLHAAPIPDAGSIIRDQQNSMQQPKELPVREPERAKPLKTEAGIAVEVKGFTFSGYEGIATEPELQALVADFQGKSLSFGELGALADKVSAHLKEKGWSQARAFLPEQEITSGIITMTITQLKSDGNISIKRDKSVRIGDPVLRGFVQSAIQPGQPINEHNLERSLLLINDIPGISTTASYLPGTATGTSALQIAVTEGSLFSGTLWGDNHGNRYTGSSRGNAMISVNDPLHYGDQISLLLTEASGLAQGRVGYTFPVAGNGFRGNLAWSGMSYELGSELAPLHYKGGSNSVDAGFSYPVLRSRTTNLTTSLSYGFRSLVDTRTDIDIRDKQLNNVTFVVSGDHYDQLIGGGGYTSYNAGFTTGTLHESIADISLTGAEGNYTRFNVGVARLQRLAEHLNVNLSGSAQMALSNLDSSEKFSLGGPNGVRAYPVGEASGDEGQLFSADLRYSLPLDATWGTVQISGFYDAGHITLNKNRYAGDVSSATGKNDYWLQGIGIGINYTWLSRLSLRAVWACVVGDNSGKSSSGNNSDGQNSNNRFWLQGSYSF